MRLGKISWRDNRAMHKAALIWLDLRHINHGQMTCQSSLRHSLGVEKWRNDEDVFLAYEDFGGRLGGDELAHTNSSPGSVEVAQRAETTVTECSMTSCASARFSDTFLHHAWTAESTHSDFVGFPQRGTPDEKIKDPSVENPEFKGSPF